MYTAISKLIKTITQILSEMNQCSFYGRESEDAGVTLKDTSFGWLGILSFRSSCQTSLFLIS